MQAGIIATDAGIISADFVLSATWVDAVALYVTSRNKHGKFQTQTCQALQTFSMLTIRSKL